MKINQLTSILIAGILFTSLTSTSLVNAQPTPTSLILVVSSPPIGKPFSLVCTIEATLKDVNGNPLLNMNIEFFYECLDDADIWHSLGTVKTDPDGVASLIYRYIDPFPNEIYNVTARFSGTTNYAPSSSEKVAIARAVDYTPYLVGCGIFAVAIIGVVHYNVFRRRKKAITTPKTTKERINPLQIGFSIIMGWIIVLGFPIMGWISPQPIIGEVMYWILPLLGESFIILGFIEKERTISPQRAKTLLQIGVVVTIFWVIYFLQVTYPYDLGLPKLYVTYGYTADGARIITPLTLILFKALPVLGIILLVLGILLKIKRRVKF